MTVEAEPACARAPRARAGQLRMAFFCMKAAVVVMALLVVAVLVLVVRINAGPIAINSLGQTIAKSLGERFGGGLRFELGGTSLVQRGLGTKLSVDRLSVTWPDGQQVLTAPRAELAVDTFSLMFGRIVPKRLEVFDLTLRAVFLRNGNMAIAAAGGARPFVEIGRAGADGAGAAPKPLAAVDTSQPAERAVVMRQAAAGLRQFLDILTDAHSPIAAVDRLGVSHGTLIIQDQETGEETVYRDLDLAFDKQHGVTNFGISAEGSGRRWTISAMARGQPGGERHFGLRIQDLTIDELRLAAGSRSRGFDMDAPVALHLDIGLRPDNSLSEAAGGFEVGQGYLRTEDPDFEPLLITNTGADFHWDGANRRVLLDRVRYVEGDTRFHAAGELATPSREGEPWTVALHLTEPGVFAPDRKGQEPVPVEAGEFRGHLLLDRKTFIIDRMAFRPKEGGLALAGQVDWVNGMHVRVGASVDPTPVPVVERLWPSPLAAEVRAWVLTHFQGGTITEGTIQIDYDENDLKRMRADRPPADKSVALDFKVTGGRVLYLDGVPPLDEVTGTAHITGHTTHLAITGATTVVDGRAIRMTNGSFTVPDSGARPIRASLSAHLAGSVEAVTGLLSRDALKPYASLPLDPATLHGNIEGDLKKSLVLGSGPDDPSLDALSVTANVSAFQAEHLMGKEGLDDATMALNVENGTVKASGQGKAFGGPATFLITRAAGDLPHAELGLTLDDAARAKLGLAAVPGVSGPITAHVDTILGGDSSKMKANIDLDLSKTAITAAYLGLSKPAGRPGRITLTIAAGADRTTIDPIAIDLSPLQGRGSIELGTDNAFQSAHFGSMKVSPGDDMKVDVSKSDDVFKLTIRGASVDARPFLKAVTSIPANEQTPLSRSAKAEKKDIEAFRGFDIDLKSNLLTGFNKEVMSGAELRLSKRDSTIRQFALQGRFGRNGVTGSMAANGHIEIAAQDAGALVSFIDLYKHMEGGSLVAKMQMGDESLAGNLEIKDFVLRDEPAIRRLVATSTTLSAPGQNAQAARRIDGDAVSFNRLKVSFERDGSHLELRDATMYGPDIGLSVDGWLDYSHDRVGMKGTFVPAYAVNNLFSQIPVFGMFLGGKSNEGLLAITFNISGRASEPNLSINPLSAITPGFLRNIFGPVFEAPTPAFSTTKPQPLR